MIHPTVAQYVPGEQLILASDLVMADTESFVSQLIQQLLSESHNSLNTERVDSNNLLAHVQELSQ